MSFVKLVEDMSEKNTKKHPHVYKINIMDENQMDEKKQSPEDLLRENGIKIKLITPTLFGVQFDFAKHYNNDIIEEILNGFNIQIKGNSVFVENK